MLTGRSTVVGPGTLETKRSVMPSSGWMRSASTLGSGADGPKSESGAALKCIEISVTRRVSRLPARM